MKKLTTPQLRALVAVLEGRVTHCFDMRGNFFMAPKGIGAATCRRLQELGLIEDVPRDDRRGSGGFLARHPQRLTKRGGDALTAWGADLLQAHGVKP